MDNQVPTTSKSLEVTHIKRKIVVWVPFLKTTMEINEEDFDPVWMVKPSLAPS